MNAQPGISCRSAQFLADRARIANQASQSPDVEHDGAIVVRLNTRRKIARQLH
jgi:hypothetical protein